MSSDIQEFIKNKMLEKGCTVIEPIPESKNHKVTYICKCKKLLQEFLKTLPEETVEVVKVYC